MPSSTCSSKCVNMGHAVEIWAMSDGHRPCVSNSGSSSGLEFFALRYNRRNVLVDAKRWRTILSFKTPLILKLRSNPGSRRDKVSDSRGRRPSQTETQSSGRPLNDWRSGSAVDARTLLPRSIDTSSREGWASRKGWKSERSLNSIKFTLMETIRKERKRRELMIEASEFGPRCEETMSWRETPQNQPSKSNFNVWRLGEATGTVRNAVENPVRATGSLRWCSVIRWLYWLD